MLTRIRQLLDAETSVAALVGVGLALAGPYLLIGLLWTSTHAQPLHDLRGIELIVSVLGSVALWPALILARICYA